MSGLTCWYEIVAIDDTAELEKRAAGSLHGAKTQLAELHAKHPAARAIFVRQYMRTRSGSAYIRAICPTFRILHKLTIGRAQ